MRRGREMINLLAVEEPKPEPAKIRAVSYEAAIDQLFKRMRLFGSDVITRKNHGKRPLVSETRNYP